MVKIERYSSTDIITIYNDRFGLDRNDQREVLKWFWENEPELCAYVMTGNILERTMNDMSEERQRFTLNWISKHNPELLREYLQKEEQDGNQ